MRQTLLSVGIDIGTTTTQLVFSKLTVENLAAGFSVPRLRIVSREVLYRSGIHFTPLRLPDEIDGESVGRIVAREYEKAHVPPHDVATGAVIITGESARKQNAERVLEAISAYAGNFVVTTAGPLLESALAGRGTGADRVSAGLGTPLVNLDVGGGTSNLALFEGGRLIAATCLDIGGRTVRVDTAAGAILASTPKARLLAGSLGADLSEGRPADRAMLGRLCDAMSELLFAAAGAGEKPPRFDALLTAGCPPLPVQGEVPAVMFSGGVADLVYGGKADDFAYGDIGVLLGRSLREGCRSHGLHLCRGAETIRATVIGAGLHATELSGSTIYYTSAGGPVKNVPVLHVPEERLHDAGSFLRARLPYFEQEGPIALAFSGAGATTFAQLEALAGEIVQGEESTPAAGPLIVVAEQDIAKALGQALDRRLRRSRALICLDGIAARDGDYIDIGEPVAGGRAVPVVVKTLIFSP